MRILNKRTIMLRQSTKVATIAVAVLMCASLLAACDTNQPGAAVDNSQSPTLPIAGQVKPTQVPPTATEIPTPTPPVLLISASHPTGEAFRSGEPAGLSNLQSDLATQVAKYYPQNGSGSGNSAASSTTGKSSTTTVSGNKTAATPTPNRIINPTTRGVAATTRPASGSTNWVYSVAGWQVSQNADDWFVDTYNSQYLIIGVIVTNKGKASAAFSSIGLQAKINGTAVAAQPDSVAKAYLDANNLSGGYLVTAGSPIAANDFKVAFTAFKFPAGVSAQTVKDAILNSTSPKGLAVPVVMPVS